MRRPNTPHFNCMTLLEFAQQYSMPNTLGDEPTCRSKRVGVIPRPYISSNPAGEKYEQYCCQSLMQHKPFCQVDDLLSEYDNYMMPMLYFYNLARSPPASRMTCIVSCRAMRRTVKTARLVCVHAHILCSTYEYIIILQTGGRSDATLPLQPKEE